jgi:putative ABC transport system ATP-binding protein
LHQIVDIQGLTKAYRSGSRVVEVLRGVDLAVAEGELVAIMGSSGSGKSTLLNVLGILDTYDQGVYRLAGELVRDLGEREAARMRNRLLGFVFQSFHLLPFKTAIENVALPLYYQGIGRRERDARAVAMLARVGLGERGEHLPSELSGGQQQRVAIARALVTKPRLLLADEPTGALDSATSQEVLELLLELHREGLTIVMVTHEPGVAARCERIVRLVDGRVVSDERQGAR